MHKNFLIILAVSVVIVILVGGYVYLIPKKTNLSNSTPNLLLATPKARASSKKDTHTVSLNPQNNSGVNGSATFEEKEGQLVVTIELNDTKDIAMPSHIHSGSCNELKEVLYPLDNVIDGGSQTILEMTLKELESNKPIALNVHKSESELMTSVACADDF